MGELTTSGSHSRDELINKMNQLGKTALLYETTAAVYVTRDNMRDLQQIVTEQAETIHELEQNLAFWLEQAGILTERVALLEGRLRVALGPV